MLICTLKGLLEYLYYALLLHIIFWSVTDSGFVLRTAFAQQNCEFRQRRVEIYYIILSSLHPQYGGQKATEAHRYKLLQLVLSGDATPLCSGSAGQLKLISNQITKCKNQSRLVS